MNFYFTPDCKSKVHLGFNYYDKIVKDYSKKINLHFGKLRKGAGGAQQNVHEENRNNIDYFNDVESASKKEINIKSSQ
jgi:hypothetical protein